MLISILLIYEENKKDGFRHPLVIVQLEMLNALLRQLSFCSAPRKEEL